MVELLEYLVVCKKVEPLAVGEKPVKIKDQTLCVENEVLESRKFIQGSAPVFLWGGVV